jgi:HK97 family phage major capsid protein
MKTNKEPKREDMQFRDVGIRVEHATDGSPKVRMSVSSETPVLTMINFNERYQRAYEILDHSPESIDMSRCADGLVVQDTHWGDQIGLMRVEVKDGKLGGEVEFCTGERAREIEADAAKGLRKNVSVGYRVDPASYRLEGDKDGVPLVRAMRWMPYEASFVPVPADTSVGVGRSMQESETIKSNGRKAKMDTNETPKLDADQVVEIYRLARAFNMEPGQADEHIKSGKSVDEFRAMTLKKAEADLAEAAKQRTAKPDRPAQVPKTEVFDEKERKEIGKRFSVMNVIRAGAGERGIDLAFEREVSDEVAKRSKKAAQGIIIPHEAMLSVRADPFLKGSNGSNMVQTTLMLPMIEVLRTRMTLAKAGMTIMSGLVGDVAIPKAGGITGGWVDGENGAGTEGKPTITQVTGTPKSASGWTDISRKMLLQSSVDAEMFVQGELSETLARLIEVAVFAGTNANGQPKGLPSWSGINNPTISSAGTPTWLEILTFLSDIESDNAGMDGMSWIMTPAVMAKLASLPKVPTYSADMILNIEQKQMAGYPFQVTMNATVKSLWLGAFSQVVLGLWSGVDIVVDPYTNSTTGAVRVVALQDCDIMVRHPQAFAYNTAVLS